MKRYLFSIFLLLVVYVAEAQNNFYFANNQRQFWRDDSTSIIVIVDNMQHFDVIAHNLLTVFSANNDTVLYGYDDDNIIVISNMLRTMNLTQLLSFISPNPSDISFVSYAKKINNRRLWLRNEAYVKLKNETSYSSYLLPFLSHFSNFSIDYDGEEDDYKITCNDETDLLQIAKDLYDTQYVYYSTPDFHCEMSLNTLDPILGPNGH